MAGRKKSPPNKTAKLPGRYRYEDHLNPADVYLSGLQEDSARVMRSALASVADILSDGKRTVDDFAWQRIRGPHVQTLRGRLQRLKYAPATANRYLSAVRGVLKEAWRMELVDRETMDRALDVEPIRGSRELHGRALDQGELLELFTACANDDNINGGIRDTAMLVRLYGTGVRRAEVVGLEVADFDP